MPIMPRDEMERVIREGGSVLYNGQIITGAAGLPSEADLAKGDPAKEAAARSSLEAQIAALQAQMHQLNQPQPQPAPAPQGNSEGEGGGEGTGGGEGEGEGTPTPPDSEGTEPKSRKK